MAVALAAGCATAPVADPFSGRYIAAAGGDHHQVVVVRAADGVFALSLQHPTKGTLVHPGGALYEARPERIAEWFGPNSGVRCLAGVAAATPALCSVPVRTSLRFRNEPPMPSSIAGWWLVVPGVDAFDATDLVKSQ